MVLFISLPFNIFIFISFFCLSLIPTLILFYYRLCRFTPTEIGTWKYVISASDSEGTANSNGVFTTVNSSLVQLILTSHLLYTYFIFSSQVLFIGLQKTPDILSVLILNQLFLQLVKILLGGIMESMIMTRIYLLLY